MTRTKVFRSGNSQAVRIPREFQFEVKEVEILRRGAEIILREPADDLSQAYELLAGMSDDFFVEGRNQPPMADREGL